MAPGRSTKFKMSHPFEIGYVLLFGSVIFAIGLKSSHNRAAFVLPLVLAVFVTVVLAAINQGLRR